MLEREFRSNYNFLNRNIDSEITFSKKVGVILPLTNENSAISNAFLKGLLKANEISQQRQKIQYIVIDNYSDPILTVEAFKDLVYKHDVSAIIGPFSDENLIAGASSVSNINVPIFSPFSALSDLSKINKNVSVATEIVFRVGGFNFLGARNKVRIENYTQPTKPRTQKTIYLRQEN